MYIQYSKSKINGKTYTYPLLCRKYRADGKIKTEVIANLSKFPSQAVLAIKSALSKSKDALVSLKSIVITKSIDYGFMFILITLMNRLRISEVLEKVLGERAKIVKLMILGKIVTRGSKLAIYNWIQRNDTIARHLGIDIQTLKLSEIYEVLGDLPNLQNKIELKWALYHKEKHKEIFLYDITSCYFEGTENALSAYGYNRDGKKGKMQIVVGLITDSEGFPLSIEVFEGNTNDHTTVIEQLRKIKKRYETGNIIFVGDRGMRIKYNLEFMEEEEKAGIGYITALSIEEIRCLIAQGTIQLNMFTKELAEIEDSGVRYVLCLNPKLEKEKAQKRESLRAKFEGQIALIQLSYQSRKEKNKKNKEKIKQGHQNKTLVTSFNEKQIDSYKYRVRKSLEQYCMQSFYHIHIDEKSFTVEFLFEKYSQAKTLDGKYVITTNVEKEKLTKDEVREQYKNLKHVEHAFRDLKTVALEIRPIFHINENTTRGHALVAMFAYTIIREMEIKIFPWLKKSNKAGKEQLSFKDIEEELKMIKLNVLKVGDNHEEIKITELSDKQKEIFKVLDINPGELKSM
jgi:transposase